MEEQKINRFKTSTKIKKVDESKIRYAKSGIDCLDQKIRGFIMGEISVVSGLNGSGKSNFLLYEMLIFALQGYKTMVFSGEMQDYIIKNTLIKMVAGKKNIKQSADGTYYFVGDDKLVDKIDKWLDDKFCLYNNECSMKVEDIIQAIKDISKNGAQIIILDNLMTMELEGYGNNKYDAQSVFIKELAKLAKSLKIHIFIVMHPRKTMGFLRKEDISGTADLSNAVDNVFIVHRNGIDFKNRSKEALGGLLEQAGIYNYDNVIEVCKNRFYGIQDTYVGLYYEKETKRMIREKDVHCGLLYDEDDTLPF